MTLLGLSQNVGKLSADADCSESEMKSPRRLALGLYESHRSLSKPLINPLTSKTRV